MPIQYSFRLHSKQAYLRFWDIFLLNISHPGLERIFFVIFAVKIKKQSLMDYKLSIHGIISSKAITQKELADLLFPNAAFPGSALRRLAELPDTIKLSQARRLAEHFGISIDTLEKNSTIFSLLNSEHICEAIGNNAIAFVAATCLDSIIHISDYGQSTLTNLQYTVLPFPSISLSNGLQKYLLNIIQS